MDDRLIYEVLEVVGEIPSGKVATYGQIARLVGRPKNARLVGKILSQVETYGDYPCHRVVNASGRLVPGWFEQKELLEKLEESLKGQKSHSPKSSSFLDGVKKFFDNLGK